ncbi:MAG: tandem-95 repeat protein, partial [Bacteroidetes bacterium]|nr:tandem-95 repeat protein [Bacteroidota bacterium]
NPGFSGTDQFSYRVQDEEGAVSNDATVTISVSTANQAPTFTSTPPTTAQRGALYRYTVTAQDPEGDPLALSAPTLPSWLTLTDQGGGEGTLEGTPGADGTYSVVLRVTDGDQASTEQSFSITVSVNAAPTVVDDEAETQEDAEVVIAVLANDSDPNGDALTVTSVTDPMHGTAAIQDDATIRYVPAPDYNGMDQFQYVVSDGINERQGTVTVTVTAVNDAPGVPTITAPDNGARITISGDPSTTMTARWEAVSDPDGDTVTYTWQLSLSETFAADDLLYETDVDEQTTASIEYGTLGPLLTERGVALEEEVRAYHRVRARDGAAEASSQPLEIVFERGTLTNAEENQTELPNAVQLAAVYPNPVRQEAHVAFSLPEAQQVTITVYDVQGRVVEVLTDRVWTAGRHQVVWEASTLPSGMYLCRLQADAIEVTRSLIRLR